MLQQRYLGMFAAWCLLVTTIGIMQSALSRHIRTPSLGRNFREKLLKKCSFAGKKLHIPSAWQADALAN
jgi:hypothetical protein